MSEVGRSFCTMTTTTNNTTGLLVKEDGALETVVLDTKEDGSNLDAMRQVMVVRTVDVVRLNADIDCWVDDQAALVAEPVLNPVLSVMLSLLDNRNHQIVGAGLFLAVDMKTGASVSLDARQRNRVETAHRMATKATGCGQYAVTVVD